jgi:hypothetical protein
MAKQSRKGCFQQCCCSSGLMEFSMATYEYVDVQVSRMCPENIHVFILDLIDQDMISFMWKRKAPVVSDAATTLTIPSQ